MNDIVAWTRVERDDPAYIARAEAESLFWQKQDVGFLETVEKIGGDSVIDRYSNMRLTGDPSTQWFATIARYGPFKRGLFLGTSGLAQDAHILETNPDLQATICDISAGSLDRWQRVLGAKFPGRVDTVTADLNFAELEANRYDLIVSSSTLHHVVNLEHIAAQINRALTADGRFFLQDYVAETFFRFGAEKKRIFEDLYNRDIARQPGRKPGLIWTNEDSDQRSPFCGIRSGDILRVMSCELNELERRTSGVIFGLLLHAVPKDRSRPGFGPRLLAKTKRKLYNLIGQRAASSYLGEAYTHELLLVDEVLSDAETFPPYNAFVTYGKRY